MSRHGVPSEWNNEQRHDLCHILNVLHTYLAGSMILPARFLHVTMGAGTPTVKQSAISQKLECGQKKYYNEYYGHSHIQSGHSFHLVDASLRKYSFIIFDSFIFNLKSNQRKKHFLTENMCQLVKFFEAKIFIMTSQNWRTKNKSSPQRNNRCVLKVYSFKWTLCKKRLGRKTACPHYGEQIRVKKLCPHYLSSMALKHQPSTE